MIKNDDKEWQKMQMEKLITKMEKENGEIKA